MMNRPSLVVLAWIACALSDPTARAEEPIPDKLVVLTFDDSVKSHYTVVRPILKKYRFGATFFITEGFDFRTNKRDYMTWDEIAELHRDGFEIGNHTRDHLSITADRVDQLAEQLLAINEQCENYGIPKPVSFAYPGNRFDLAALPRLAELGIRFARRGGEPEFAYDSGKGYAFEPGLDHTLLIPSAADARPNWTLDNFIVGVEQARHGRIAVLQFHGVPDRAHPWVNLESDEFEACMKYLALHDYQVVALRDLDRFIPRGMEPRDPEGVIRDRQAARKSGDSRANFRTPSSDDELRRWLENMAVYHRFSRWEMAAATGLSPEKIDEALARFELRDRVRPARQAPDPLTVLPYPGGRHPRIGFRDGMIRPQRETKLSIFTPWNPDDYVVADIPEAIWWEPAETQRELLFLGHTHVPTTWDRRGTKLEPLEWSTEAGNVLVGQRTLPNDVTFATRIKPSMDHVDMAMSITNGTEQTLRGLRVQNCIMLRNAAGFAQQTVDNKVFREPYVACHNPEKTRWIITAWTPCLRAWGNESCPCLHSDPQFPDCPPGQTTSIRGWLSFYEGSDLDGELRRIEQTGWHETPTP